MDTTIGAVEGQDLMLYGGSDPRTQPLYSFPEGARATGIPVSTLRSWVVGQEYPRRTDVAYFEPVITRPTEEDTRLSFLNLIEAHVLRALRTVHEVSLNSVRKAIEIAEQEYGIEHLLVSPDLRTGAGRLFLDRYGRLLELSESKQYAMRNLLLQYLERVDYSADSLPRSFMPFERSPRNMGKMLIALSPYVSFGRAVLRSSGISVQAIVQRIDAGESTESIADDYGITEQEIEEAILYESAA